ncbi:MAG: EB domain-containing protein, partial [Persicimonas sp.]
MGGLLVGCGEQAGEDGREQPSNTLQICTPDPELVAEKRRCQVDDDCPCGTHCSLGQCVASCTEAADCADGETCDSFGRCRQEGETALVPVPSQDAEGRLALETSTMYFDEAGEAVTTVRVEQRGVGRARVVASNGAEVQCPDASGYAASCELTELNAGDTVEVSARRADGAHPNAIAELTVYGPQNSESASIIDVGQEVGGTVLMNNDDTLPEPVAGRYEGTLRLVGAGTDADLDNLPGPPVAVASDLTATVRDEDGEVVIAIDDDLGYLTSSEALVGTLSLGADDDADGVVEGTGSFVDHPFIDDAVVAGRANALIVETVEATVESQLNPRSLGLSLTQSYRGMGMDIAPTVRWVVQLERIGDADGAPQLPQAAQLDFDPQQRLASLSPWEEALAPSLPAYGQAYETLIVGTIEPQMLNLDPLSPTLCGLDNDEARREAHRLLSEFIMGHRPTWFSRSYHESESFTSSTWLSKWLLLEAHAKNSEYIPSGDLPDSGVSPTPEFFDDGIVCGFEQMAVSMEFPDGETTTATSDQADVCDIMAEVTGCRIEDIDEPVELTMPVSWQDLMNEWTPTTTTAQVKRRCVLPSMHASCGEQIACLGPATERIIGDRGSRFTQETVAQIGDLTCEGNDLSGGLGIDRDAETLTAEAIFERCMTDVAKLADAPPEGQRERLVSEMLDYDAECVDVPRLLSGITIQGRSLHTGNIPLNDEAEARASAYTQRLLARWLQIHGFFAAESIQREKIADVLRQEDDADALLPEPDAVLQMSLRGWDMLLDPAVAVAVYKMGHGALEEPDYRIHRHDLDGLPDDEVTRGLAPVIVQTLTRQSELLHRFIDKHPRGVEFGDGEDNPLAMMMPRMLVAQTMAAELRRRAAQTGAEIPWMDSLDSQIVRADARFGELASLIASLRSGANPLGIDDEDLPLYFLADSADGPGGRF